jgi:hypothetical protein
MRPAARRAKTSSIRKIYTNGSSERFVGEFVKDHRESAVLATKYTNAAPGNDPNAAGNHRESMMQAVEASLKRFIRKRKTEDRFPFRSISASQPVIRPGSMPSAKITCYKPTSWYLSADRLVYFPFADIRSEVGERQWSPAKTSL